MFSFPTTRAFLFCDQPASKLRAPAEQSKCGDLENHLGFFMTWQPWQMGNHLKTWENHLKTWEHHLKTWDFLREQENAIIYINCIFCFWKKKTVNRDVFDGNMIYKWRLKWWKIINNLGMVHWKWGCHENMIKKLIYLYMYVLGKCWKMFPETIGKHSWFGFL